MNNRRTRDYARLAGTMTLFTMLALFIAACATAPIPETGEGAVVANFDIGDTNIVVPESLPGGIVTVNVNNTRAAPQEFMLVRLNPNVTLEQFMDVFSQNPDEAIPLVQFAGGRDAQPGQTNSFTADLSEGTHVAVVFPEDDNPPLVASFPVAGAGAGEGEAPSADVTVDMIDFNFNMPETVPSGEQTWEVTNTGAQWHHIVLFRREPGLSEAQLMEMLMSEQEPPDPSPVDEAGVFGPISQGETGWVTFNLEPGDYTAVCFLPDFGSGQSHFELGMIHSFTVGQ